jgi:uncharacterized membrane protein YfcA
MNIWLLTLIIFILAIFTVMTGHGGGNFFILALVLADIDMHIAAASVQFILFTTVLAAMFVFKEKKLVEWKLAIFIGILIALSAFFGGYFSRKFEEKILKLILAAMLFLLSVLMLKPVKEKNYVEKKTLPGFWIVKSQDNTVEYNVNLWIVVPLIILFGFIAGMVGVSGGSFIVPILVLSCGVPMKNAVGTASALIFISAFTGFTGHFLAGHFDYHIALPLAVGGVGGGILGGKIAIKTNQKLLKILFSIMTFLAAVIMAYKFFK